MRLTTRSPPRFLPAPALIASMLVACRAEAAITHVAPTTAGVSRATQSMAVTQPSGVVAGNTLLAAFYSATKGTAGISASKAVTQTFTAGTGHCELSLPRTGIKCLPTTAPVTTCSNTTNPCAAASETTATLTAPSSGACPNTGTPNLTYVERQLTWSGE
jgi:hypothetical protein